MEQDAKVSDVDAAEAVEVAPADTICGRDAYPSWLPAVDLAVGAGLLVPGIVLFGKDNVTAGNPTVPSLLTGVGAGAMLSGAAIAADRGSCAVMDEAQRARTERAVMIVTAAETAIVVGLGAAFTLTHDSSSPPSSAAAGVGAAFMILASAGTTVGMHFLGGMGNVQMGAAPTAGGGAAFVGASF